jgi:hypothetical protein
MRGGALSALHVDSSAAPLRSSLPPGVGWIKSAGGGRSHRCRPIDGGSTSLDPPYGTGGPKVWRCPRITGKLRFARATRRGKDSRGYFLPEVRECPSVPHFFLPPRVGARGLKLSLGAALHNELLGQQVRRPDTHHKGGAGRFLPRVWGCPPILVFPSPKIGGSRGLMAGNVPVWRRLSGMGQSH